MSTSLLISLFTGCTMNQTSTHMHTLRHTSMHSRQTLSLCLLPLQSVPIDLNTAYNISSASLNTLHQTAKTASNHLTLFTSSNTTSIQSSHTVYFINLHQHPIISHHLLRQNSTGIQSQIIMLSAPSRCVDSHGRM